MSLADFTEAPLDVWPCNWEAVQLFIAVSTQWRMGFAGAYGLDYSAVAAVMDMHGVKQRRRKKLLWQIRWMEREVLAMWAENQNGK